MSEKKTINGIDKEALINLAEAVDMLEEACIELAAKKKAIVNAAAESKGDSGNTAIMMQEELARAYTDNKKLKQINAEISGRLDNAIYKLKRMVHNGA